jgi:hypothetical protein
MHKALFWVAGGVVWTLGAAFTFAVAENKTDGEVGLLALATCVAAWPIYLPLVYFFADP